jgi:hypothetical protein
MNIPIISILTRDYAHRRQRGSCRLAQGNTEELPTSRSADSCEQKASSRYEIMKEIEDRTGGYS